MIGGATRCVCGAGPLWPYHTRVNGYSEMGCMVPDWWVPRDGNEHYTCHRDYRVRQIVEPISIGSMQ